jgi:putative membrane protein
MKAPARLRAVAAAPTDFLANERTFLAWVRTALTVIGLGFVVARFGLFLRAVATGSPGSSSPASEAVGIALVLAGSALVGFAWVRFRSVQRELRAGAYVARATTELILAATLVAVGIVLAAYLVVSG